MLAIALGLTPVYVNRILQAFRREQLITLEQRRLTLLDVEKLQGISGLKPRLSAAWHYAVWPHALFRPRWYFSAAFDRRGANRHRRIEPFRVVSEILQARGPGLVLRCKALRDRFD